MTDSQSDFAFSTAIVIFPARCLCHWMVEPFMRILPHLLAAGKPKCKLHVFFSKGYNYWACSAYSISSSSFVVLALLHWLNAEIWAMYGHVLFVSLDLDSVSQFEKLTETFLYKIRRVGIDMCLTVYLHIFCTTYIVWQLNRGNLLPGIF